MMLMLKSVGLNAHKAWMRIPPAQRKAILRAARSEMEKHGPTVARTVRHRGPVVAKRLSEAIRESRAARRLSSTSRSLVRKSHLGGRGGRA